MRYAAPFALAWTLLSMGCEDRRAAAEATCEDTRDCPGGLVCLGGLCRPPGECATSDDCCPGAECVAGACADIEPDCAADGDCLDGALTCVGGHCLRRTCDDRPDCPEGALCVGGHCHRDPPCRGACTAAQACFPHVDLCRGAPPDCTGSCGDGFVRVVSQPREYLGAACDLSDGVCECVRTPALVPADFGRHASMSVLRGEAVFAAYDADYGDLVYVEQIESGVPRVTYLDGVSDAAPIRADPAGPRGGRTEPGPDRGRYASLAIDPKGRPHIAYYDADVGALRYMRADEAGVWGAPVVVDDDGDAGRYARVDVDADGRPHIVYHVARTADGQTGLRYATAPPEGGGFVVHTVSTRAAGAGEVPPPGVPPDAHGVRPCLRVGRDGLVYIGFYDGQERWLYLAVGAPGAFEVQPLTGERAEDWPADPGGRYERLDTHDLGRFCSIAPEFGVGVHVAFTDGTTDALLFYRGAVTGGGTIELVDPGGRGLRRLVGADPALDLDRAGRPVVVYQDATDNDVLMSVRGVDGWSPTPLVVASAGALGFYNSLVVVEDEAVVGTLELETTAGGRGAHRLHVIRSDVPRF